MRHTGSNKSPDSGKAIAKSPFLLIDVAMLDNVDKVNGVPSNELEGKRGADTGIRGGTRWGRIQIGQQRGGRIIARARTSGDDEKKE